MIPESIIPQMFIYFCTFPKSRPQTLFSFMTSAGVVIFPLDFSKGFFQVFPKGHVSLCSPVDQ